MRHVLLDNRPPLFRPTAANHARSTYLLLDQTAEQRVLKRPTIADSAMHQSMAVEEDSPMLREVKAVKEMRSAEPTFHRELRSIRGGI